MPRSRRGNMVAVGDGPPPESSRSRDVVLSRSFFNDMVSDFGIKSPYAHAEGPELNLHVRK